MHKKTPILAMLAGLFAATISAQAAVVEGNLDLSFHERASLSAAINVTRPLDPTLATQRLVNERLGTWTGTTIQFLNVQHRIGVALNDPGVSEAPSEARPLIRVETIGELSGGPIGGGKVISPLNLQYICAASFLSCNTETVLTTMPLLAPASALTTASQALEALSIKASSAQTEVLFPGTTLRLGSVPAPPTALLNFDQSYHELQGTIRLRASYQTKTYGQYVSDGLAATAAPQATWASRLGHAAADINSLRALSLQSFSPLAGTTPVAGVDELREAHATLAAARDAATWQALGATPGGSLNTGSTLIAGLWNLGAAAEPGLARSAAGFAGEPTFFADARTEVAAVRAALGATSDESFMSLLDLYTGSGIAVGSSSPLFTLDGADFGLDGALLQVFYTDGDSSSGRFEIALPDATSHALWKPGMVNSFELVSGPADGVMVTDWGLLQIGNGEVYVGENEELRLLSGGQIRLALNNLYSPQTIVVASWGVTAPVPEPETWTLLLAGLGLVGFAAHRGKRRAV